MVDRVGNGPGYGYPQINEKKVNTGVAGTGEKFQLDYGKEGAIYEPSSESLKKQEKEKEATLKAKADSKATEDGVRLTLSSEAVENNNFENTDNGSLGGILEKVTNAVNDVIGIIKQFVSRIWNDAPQEKNATDVLSVPKTEKPKTEFEKAKAEAEAFLASEEGKKAARNSDLLTYYDKRGTVVQVSPSDRQRILYGDKNQIEV